MAAGDTLLVLDASNFDPAVSSPASQDARNGILVWDFDASTDEEIVSKVLTLPRRYGGGGLDCNFTGMMSSATSGNVVVQAGIERWNAADDHDSDAFAALQSSGQVAVAGTAGIDFSGTVSFTDGAQMDSLAAGEKFRIKFRRDADDTSATDDATGDFEFSGVEIRETP